MNDLNFLSQRQDAILMEAPLHNEDLVAGLRARSVLEGETNIEDNWRGAGVAASVPMELIPNWQEPCSHWGINE